MSSKVHKTLEN